MFAVNVEQEDGESSITVARDDWSSDTIDMVDKSAVTDKVEHNGGTSSAWVLLSSDGLVVREICIPSLTSGCRNSFLNLSRDSEVGGDPSMDGIVAMGGV